MRRSSPAQPVRPRPRAAAAAWIKVDRSARRLPGKRSSGSHCRPLLACGSPRSDRPSIRLVATVFVLRRRGPHSATATQDSPAGGSAGRVLRHERDPGSATSAATALATPRSSGTPTLGRALGRESSQQAVLTHVGVEQPRRPARYDQPGPAFVIACASHRAASHACFARNARTKSGFVWASAPIAAVVGPRHMRARCCPREARHGARHPGRWV